MKYKTEVKNPRHLQKWYASRSLEWYLLRNLEAFVVKQNSTKPSKYQASYRRKLDWMVWTIVKGLKKMRYFNFIKKFFYVTVSEWSFSLLPETLVVYRQFGGRWNYFSLYFLVQLVFDLLNRTWNTSRRYMLASRNSVMENRQEYVFLNTQKGLDHAVFLSKMVDSCERHVKVQKRTSKIPCHKAFGPL